jgi:hypothetical protein
MTLTYSFEYDITDTYSIDFDDYKYELEDAELDEVIGEFRSEYPEDCEGLTDEEVTELDGFYDYAYEYCRDAAKDQFDEDDNVREEAYDAYEYRRDPYSYYGVSRSWFI